MVRLSIIAAISENRVIGDDGDIPWDIPEDIQHYRDTVDDSVVISGRVTFETTPGEYQGRQHIVLSRRDTIDITSPNIHHAQDPEEGIQIAEEITDASETVHIIGGESVYRVFLDRADSMILSHVHSTYTGDTHFPKYDGDKWITVSTDVYEDFTIKEYTRANPSTQD